MGWGLGEEDFDNQQAGSDDDRAIGYVEGGPLILADVEEQEIHYATVQQAVPEVAQSSSQNQSEANSGGAHRVAVAPEQGRDDDQGHNRKKDQHGDFPLGGRIGEQTEGGTAIFHVSDPEKAGNHLYTIVQGDIPGDDPLSGAIEQHDQEGDEEVDPAH